MTSGELLALFRSEMMDLETPYLWSDTEIYSYIDDAQKMFCRETDGIADATTNEVVEISVVEGSDWVSTHPSILKIRGLTRADTGRSVEVVNHEDLPVRGWFFDGTAGPVRGLVIGMENHKARVYPVSTEIVTLRMTVFRLPLEDISTDQDFEIESQHHRHLLLWVKSLAYLKEDTEVFNRTKSMEYEGKFLAYCAKSKIEARRTRHKPRSVAYGGY